MSKIKIERLRAALLQAAEALAEALAAMDLPASDDPALDAEDWAPVVDGEPAGFELGGEA